MVLHIQFSGFYKLHGPLLSGVGVCFEESLRGGFSVDQHHRGVVEVDEVVRRTVVVLLRDYRNWILDADIPGNLFVKLRRHRDAESAYEDRSHYGDDEQSCDLACVFFHFAFLLCNHRFRVAK